MWASGNRDAREFDLVSGLSIPLPMIVIAELLGVEPERRHDFKRWSDLIIEVSTGPGREKRFDRMYTGGFADLLATTVRECNVGCPVVTDARLPDRLAVTDEHDAIEGRHPSEDRKPAGWRQRRGECSASIRP